MSPSMWLTLSNFQEPSTLLNRHCKDTEIDQNLWGKDSRVHWPAPSDQGEPVDADVDLRWYNYDHNNVQEQNLTFAIYETVESY